eukprot:992807-Pelagomonas_calceolata.AAC.1
MPTSLLPPGAIENSHSQVLEPGASSNPPVAFYFCSFVVKGIQGSSEPIIRNKLNEPCVETKKRKVYAGHRPRASREVPLTGKLEASPEGPLNLH